MAALYLFSAQLQSGVTKIVVAPSMVEVAVAKFALGSPQEGKAPVIDPIVTISQGVKVDALINDAPIYDVSAPHTMGIDPNYRQ